MRPKHLLILAMCLVSIVCAFCSCGTTRATISRPAEGTQTTITITTNNPVSTQVDPTITYTPK